MHAPEGHAVTLEGTVLCDDSAPAAVLQVALTYGPRRVVKACRARFVLVTGTGQWVSIKTREETVVEGLATTTCSARWEVLAASDAGRTVAAEALPATSFGIVPRFVPVAGEAPQTRDVSLLWMPWLLGVYVSALKVSLLAALLSADTMCVGRRRCSRRVAVGRDG